MGNFYSDALADQFRQVGENHARILPAESHARSDGDGRHSRDVSLLQQRAGALEREIEHRKSLERALREALSDRRQVERELRRSEDALREEARIAETLHAIGKKFATELDLEKLVQAVTDVATSLVKAKFGAFSQNVVDDDGEAYLLYTLSGAPKEGFDPLGLPRNTPLFEPTFRGLGIVRYDDVTQAPEYGRMSPHHGMPPKHLPVRSYLAVPVVAASGEVLGGLW
jgi:hypothetical protein